MGKRHKRYIQESNSQPKNLESSNFIEPVSIPAIGHDLTNQVEKVYNPYSDGFKARGTTVADQMRDEVIKALNDDSIVSMRAVNPSSLLESFSDPKKKIKTVKVNKGEFKQLYENSGTKLRESGWDTGDDWTSGNDMTNEYMPIMMGPFYRQLYLFDYLDMQRKAFWAYHHDPIAGQLVNLVTYFTLGRGVSLKVNDDGIDADFKKWWADNKMDERMDSISNELSIYGEVMLRLNRVGKNLTIKPIDPSTVWEVVTDPLDIEKVYFYYQNFPTQYQIFSGDVKVAQYVINQIPYNEVIHEKINCVSNEKRGRSDLFPLFGLLKSLRDYTSARVVRGIIQSNFVWDVEIQGSAQDVANYIAQDPQLQNPPKPGSNYVHNQAIKMEPKGVNLGSKDSNEDFNMLLTLIAAGAGIPKEYLNIGDKSTKATALVAAEPVYKKFEKRQKKLEAIIHKIYDAWKYTTGADVKYAGKDQTLEVTFPELATEDRSQKMKDVALAESMDWISHETAANLGANELHVSTYDFDTEAQKIKGETDVFIADQFKQAEKNKAAAAKPLF